MQPACNVNWQSPKREKEREREPTGIDHRRLWRGPARETEEKERRKEKVAICGFTPLSSAILVSPIRVRRKFTPVWTYASGLARSGDFLIATWRCHTAAATEIRYWQPVRVLKPRVISRGHRFARWWATSNKFRWNDELPTLRTVDVRSWRSRNIEKRNYSLREMLKKSTLLLKYFPRTREQRELCLELKLFMILVLVETPNETPRSRSLSNFLGNMPTRIDRSDSSRSIVCLSFQFLEDHFPEKWHIFVETENPAPEIMIPVSFSSREFNGSSS